MTSSMSVAEYPRHGAYSVSVLDNNVTSNGMRNAVAMMPQLVTTAGMGSSYYQPVLPRNLDIFSEVERGLGDSSIKDDQRQLARKLAASLKTSLLNNYRQMHMDLPYSELHMSVLDDSAVLIEWTYLNLRAGFSIERNVNDSSYYVLVRVMEDGVSTIVPEYGPLNGKNVDAVAAKVVARISEKL